MLNPGLQYHKFPGEVFNVPATPVDKSLIICGDQYYEKTDVRTFTDHVTVIKTSVVIVYMLKTIPLFALFTRAYPLSLWKDCYP